ncbi:MAG TPA: hypothetical protein VEW03_05600 [Longimicrobiaceae bacterium]|nr:hypothetical protein [Longimicrobiaceae bacterium]
MHAITCPRCGSLIRHCTCHPPRAMDRMEPLPGAIASSAGAEAARRRLGQEGLAFLVVVAAGTGKLVGAVDDESLAPGRCCERPGTRCTVVQHLAPNVDFCFEGEQAGEIVEAEADLAGRGKVPAARRIPLIVVDDQLKPRGWFTEVAVRRRAPVAVACLAA